MHYPQKKKHAPIIGVVSNGYGWFNGTGADPGAPVASFNGSNGSNGHCSAAVLQPNDDGFSDAQSAWTARRATLRSISGCIKYPSASARNPAKAWVMQAVADGASRFQSAI